MISFAGYVFCSPRRFPVEGPMFMMELTPKRSTTRAISQYLTSHSPVIRRHSAVNELPLQYPQYILRPLHYYSSVCTLRSSESASQDIAWIAKGIFCTTYGEAKQ